MVAETSFREGSRAKCRKRAVITMIRKTLGGAGGQADVHSSKGILYRRTICHGELQDQVGKQDTILIRVPAVRT